MVDKSSAGEVIVDCVELRREFEDRRSRYDRLLNLVTLIINAALDKKNIRIHSMTKRVKDYSSFLEKIERKRYDDPYKQCTDIAGCRIICLFTSQVDEIQKIVEDEFEVIDVTDKRTTKKFDQFGYLSLHMLIKIPKDRVKFIECSDLHDLVCEVQIRTILQEAWAEIEHHLNYKATKEEKNQELLRKIFSLAGMFEVADATFEEIHTGFSHLIRKKMDIEEENITALNLYKFSKEYFMWYNKEWDKREERVFLNLSNETKKIDVNTIKQIKDILDKYKREIEKYESYHKQRDKKSKDRYFSAVGLIRAALALEYGKKFDMAFGLNGYSERVKKEISIWP
jgi:putative GTP pyrophosphokinase